MRPYAVIAALGAAALAGADVKLASLFTSNMVFQQRTEAPIWGTAAPGEQVTIRTTWGANATAVAGEDGRWRTKVRTGAAGGPYEVSVTGGNSLWLRNVMLGEVWVCSGQSNMEWPLGVFPGLNPVRNSAEEVAGANFPNIRLFQVEKKMADTLQESCGGSWVPCSPQTVADFSATGYLFGRGLHQALGVPVGLIMTAWGGTEVELWTSEPALRRMPSFAEALDQNEVAAAATRTAIAEQKKRLEADKGKGWEREDLDDADWQRLVDPASYEATELDKFDGSVWYRAKVLLTAAQAKSPAVLHLGPIDDMDETWVNGTRVGGLDQWEQPREYKVPVGVLREGLNTITIRTVDTGGLGGFRQPEKIGWMAGETRIPLTNWRMKVGVNLADTPLPANQGKAHSMLYNGMIAPLIPFAIRGAIWYQGESNVSRAFQYRTSFPNMIQNWREDWGQGDFPFYFVQIAPFEYNQNDASAELREAQAMTLSRLPNTGMAVTVDVVPDVKNIHPPFKQEVGDRLSRLALNLTYGKKDVACFGPMYQSAKLVNDKFVVRFQHADGLKIEGDKLAGIEIAGDDKVFKPAEAKVDGQTLVVWSDAVAKPVAVRFGWRDASVTNLFNGAGLPAPPFRSDDWPGITIDVKW